MEELDGSFSKVGPGTERQQGLVYKGRIVEGWAEVAKRASDKGAYTTVKVADLRVSTA